MSKLQVAVTLYLDVDPEAWALTYGIEGDENIAADVVDWVGSRVYDDSGENKIDLDSTSHPRFIRL